MKNLKHIALAILVLASLFAVSAQAETAVSPASEIPAVEIEATDATTTDDASEILEPTALEIELGLVPNILRNPCYQFDNPAIGCYRTWSPQTFCCLSNGNPGCFDLCY